MRIESYVEGATEDEFFKTPLIQDGVIRQIAWATAHGAALPTADARRAHPLRAVRELER